MERCTGSCGDCVLQVFTGRCAEACCEKLARSLELIRRVWEFGSGYLKVIEEHVQSRTILWKEDFAWAQAGNLLRKALPDYLRGWGFVTSDTNDKPSLFNMTQVLLIGTGPKGCVLDAREWGGAYAEDWTDYVAPANPKQMPPEQLDRLQPLFSKVLAQQTGRLMQWITVTP